MFTTILTIAPILSTGSNLIMKKLQTEELGKLTLEIEKQTKEIASIYSEVRVIQLEGFYLGMNKLREIARPEITYDEFIVDINSAKDAFLRCRSIEEARIDSEKSEENYKFLAYLLGLEAYCYSLKGEKINAILKYKDALSYLIISRDLYKEKLISETSGEQLINVAPTVASMNVGRTIGILGGPVGMLVGTLVGAAIGAGATKRANDNQKERIQTIKENNNRMKQVVSELNEEIASIESIIDFHN